MMASECGGAVERAIPLRPNAAHPVQGPRRQSGLGWEKGARGTRGRGYPWGNRWRRNRCRYSKNGYLTCGVWAYKAGRSPWEV